MADDTTPPKKGGYSRIFKFAATALTFAAISFTGATLLGAFSGAAAPLSQTIASTYGNAASTLGIEALLPS